MTDLAMDYLGLDALLSAEELAWRDKVRAFVRDCIRPSIKDWYEKAVFPAEIVPEMGRPACSAHTCPAMAAPAAAPSSTGWPRWNWRPATRGCGPSSACRARWP